MLNRKQTTSQHIRWQIKCNVVYLGAITLFAWLLSSANNAGGWVRNTVNEFFIFLTAAWAAFSFWFFVAVVVGTIYVVARGGLNRDSEYWERVDMLQNSCYIPPLQPPTKEAPHDGHAYSQDSESGRP